MNIRVGESQIKKAKSVQLQRFLLEKLPDLISKDVSTDRFYYSKNKDICILDRGFVLHKTGQRGDQIQFLEDYLGKAFQEAVYMLIDYAESPGAVLIDECEIQENSNPEKFVLPKATNGLYKCVWAYLVRKRNIPAEIVERLFDEKLLYQSEYCNNCVFSSLHCDYAELHGTSDAKFNGIVKNSERDGYWQFGDGGDTLYLCKSAIDAISLYILFKEAYPDKKINVASIGGYKEETVSRLIKEDTYKIILAVDKTEEGISFGDRFENLPKIRVADMIMTNKDVIDWNDMLCEAPLITNIKNTFEDVYYVSDRPF